MDPSFQFYVIDVESLDGACSYVRGMLDLSEACEGKQNKTNNYFGSIRARFLINVKQDFCKNIKVLNTRLGPIKIYLLYIYENRKYKRTQVTI